MVVEIDVYPMCVGTHGGVQPHKHLGAHCTVVLYTLTEHPD